ncbi:hypothetical protein LCGC14_1899460 [marine sediment metagenome]|uniref:DUF1737 domain-containing protein n=1 Tax=marine sediment metagenome TaxID=412755 RepID=A0A0F9FX14_9ZZZZ
MKPYIIVIGRSFEELEENVNLLLVEGYLPTGGPIQLGGYFTQAVYLPNVCAVFRPAPPAAARSAKSITNA